MSIWEWLKMKMSRKVETSPVVTGEEFDQMLEAERQQATEAKQEAVRQHEQAKNLRSKSWYLHGQFERAKTGDPFSEWLFQDRPKGTTP